MGGGSGRGAREGGRELGGGGGVESADFSRSANPNVLLFKPFQ